jgi:hypothetical protein
LGVIAAGTHSIFDSHSLPKQIEEHSQRLQKATILDAADCYSSICN